MVEVVCILHLISDFLSRMHLKIFVKYPLILQKWVSVMGGGWTWLFTLLNLFVTFFRSSFSEENESDIWNKIALINESTMENDWQFSSHLYRTSSKSIQDYGLLFLPCSSAKSFKSITSSQHWTKQPKPTYCYEGKRIVKIHQTKLSAAVSSMWKLAQMTQIVVFPCAQ